ncbi:TRAP transporter TatT component family protein [Ralstonia sp. 24A2]|uniref:TRAP transporter TatT component family protein n=1 Tax=Ralstonia sp. 24A2 TaxID=3447364 RepID=UPI003F695685
MVFFYRLVASKRYPLVFRLLTLVVIVSLAACSPKNFVVNKIADEWSSQSMAQEDDLVLAREASAFYLKFSESLLEQTPGHVALGESVASGFTQYAYAFVNFDAERTAGRDANAALRLRQRAARLYLRAHRHAMSVLEYRHRGFSQALADSTSSLSLDVGEVGLAYWAAASWGAYISLSKDKPDVVADLPLVVRLARLAWAREPNYADGSLASLVATLEMARPGGSRAEAERIFDQAEKIGSERNAGIYVARAEALHESDRDEYERLLREALRVSTEHPSLANQLVHDRCTWLLKTMDERF